jgi:iron(III) transport system permease protein
MIREKQGLLLRSSTAVKALLFAFFTVMVALPLLRMFYYLSEVDITSIVTSMRFREALSHSVVVSVVSMLISVALALLLAYALARSNIRFKSFWRSVLVVPMLIPSISHGIGLLILLGRNGFLSKLFGLESGIYGFWGIVIGSVLYSFPVAFLMLSDILLYEDSTPYDAASVLGIPKLRQFGALTVPYLRKPMITVMFAVLTMIITDYGVPLMIGGQYNTLPVMMYRDVIGQTDFGKGAVIGLVLLVPAVVAFLIDLLNRDKGNLSFIIQPFRMVKSYLRDGASYVLCVVVCVVVLLPIGAFLMLSIVEHYPIDMTLTMHNFERVMGMKTSLYLRNSLLIATGVSLIGTILGFCAAYFTARMKSWSSRLLHLVTITSMAIPGLVLGLSYVLFFNGTPIYNTMIILVFVNLIHFVSSPYLMMYNTLNKLNENLEDVGATLGVSRLRIIRDVVLPQVKGTALEMISYFFVNSMMTISAVSFLWASATKPISLMIPQFEATMNLEAAAVVSLIILTINLGVKVIISLSHKVFAGKDRD